jgi:hypothetical protein
MAQDFTIKITGIPDGPFFESAAGLTRMAKRNGVELGVINEIEIDFRELVETQDPEAFLQLMTIGHMAQYLQAKYGKKDLVK